MSSQCCSTVLLVTKTNNKVKINYFFRFKGLVLSLSTGTRFRSERTVDHRPNSRYSGLFHSEQTHWKQDHRDTEGCHAELFFYTKTIWELSLHPLHDTSSYKTICNGRLHKCVKIQLRSRQNVWSCTGCYCEVLYQWTISWLGLVH